MRGYYFITDESLSRAGSLSDVREAVAAGVEVVQYRQKEASSQKMYEQAQQMKEICRGILFLINDRVDIALAVNADGVHLGQDDLPYSVARGLLGPRKTIGITVHNILEAQCAENMGADYLGVSPIFFTGTKLDAGKPAGIGLIEQIKAAVKIPIIAIGGINLANAPQVIRAGADGLCAISAVITSPDVRTEIGRFQSLFENRAASANR